MASWHIYIFWIFIYILGDIQLMELKKLKKYLNFEGEVKNRNYFTRVPLTYDENQFCLEEGGSKNRRGAVLKSALRYYRNKEHIDTLINRIIEEVRKIATAVPAKEHWPTLEEKKAEIAALRVKPELTEEQQKDLDRGLAKFDIAGELADRFSQMQKSKQAINETVKILRDEQSKYLEKDNLK